MSSFPRLTWVGDIYEAAGTATFVIGEEEWVIELEGLDVANRLHAVLVKSFLSGHRQAKHDAKVAAHNAIERITL